MISLPGRVLTRRKLAAGATVAVALAAFAAVKTTGVEAHPATTTQNFSCTTPLLGTTTLPFGVEVTTEHDPLTITEGDQVVLSVKTSAPTGIDPALAAKVLGMGLTIPIPEQVDQTVAPSVQLVGGNLTGTWQKTGNNLVITLTGNSVPAEQVQLPEFRITSTLKTGIGGQTINWRGPSQLTVRASVTVVVSLTVDLTCAAAAANEPVAVTPVGSDGTGQTTTTHGEHGHDTTTTTRSQGTTTRQQTTTTHGEHGHDTTTTTRGVTTTTRGVTTTTRGVTTTTHGEHGHDTTTTTRGVTTTTRGMTTTTRGMTTTTRGMTTTTRGSSSIIDFFRSLICRIFRFFSFCR